MLISVVVVTFNSARVLSSALAGLAAEPDLEVIIVDNASRDATVELARRLHPGARVIVNRENVGYARAVNTGCRIARGGYVLLLNPDAVIDPDGIRRLARRARELRAGAIAPLIASEGRRTVDAGRFPSLLRLFFHSTGISRLGWSSLEGLYLFANQVDCRRPRQVDWATAACLLIDRFDWLRLGGMSERWFMYGEDIDFCLRLNRNGRTVFLDPTVTARHEGGGSSSGVDGSLETAWLTNLYDVYSEHMARSDTARKAWRLFAMAGYTGRWAAFAARNRTPLRRPGDARDRDRFRVYAAAASLMRVSPVGRGQHLKPMAVGPLEPGLD